jgi:hypothetical protein
MSPGIADCSRYAERNREMNEQEMEWDIEHQTVKRKAIRSEIALRDYIMIRSWQKLRDGRRFR